jgi:hypothetical protein
MEELREEETQCALVAFARNELDIIMKQAEQDGEEAVEMQKMFNDNIIEVVDAFCRGGHSGFSAEMAITAIERLLRWRPLTRLTLEDDEFVEVSEGVWQNKRAGNVFKQTDRFDGEPYCIDGPNGEFVSLKEYPYAYLGIWDKANTEE